MAGSIPSGYEGIAKLMSKILRLKEAIRIAKKLREQGKTIVLSGGVFDILHIGHVRFLERAKNQGDYLFVLLENDGSVKKLKGKNRPINSQKNRAIILSSLTSVDYVVLLPTLRTDHEYDRIVIEIKPEIIATTAKDPNIIHKKRQANQINGKVLTVLNRISDQSTTKLAKLIEAGS